MYKPCCRLEEDVRSLDTRAGGWCTTFNASKSAHMIISTVDLETHVHRVHPCPRQAVIERFRDSRFTDRITYRQSVKLMRNLEFRASFAQLYVYVWRKLAR